MNAFSAPLRTSEIYQGFQTSSEHSICSPSSSEPFMSPPPGARELYEGLRTPDWLEQTDFEVGGAEEWRVSPSLYGKNGIFKDDASKRELADPEFGKVYKGRLNNTKKKVVLKVDIHDDKSKYKAMKAVSSFSGIDSISMDMKKKTLTVIGTDFDPVKVVNKLRKAWYTELVYVGPATEPENKKL